MTGLPYGAGLVARQEFRIRLRTGRWRWLLAGWVVLVGGFTVLVDLALSTGYGYDTDTTRRGVPIFGILMFFVLAMVMVISPALTSQTVNGDRERGTLATLQVTLLQPTEIAVGKLLAGWGVGLVMLALTLPFTGYAMLRGGVGVARAAAVYGVVALLIGVVCAISQGLSALLARSITSALLSYLTVFALTVGTLIAFGLATALVTTKHTYVNGADSYTVDENRPDLVWWLLAPNPFAVLADSTPRVPPRYTANGDSIEVDQYDILSAVGNEVRQIRRPPSTTDQFVYNADGTTVQPVQHEDLPIWPWGLGFDLLVGAGALVVTTRRLRTPSRKLGRGVRIA
jgi:ABC-2 type transport system permease protein